MLMYVGLSFVQFSFWPLECHRKPEILLDNLDKENYNHTIQLPFYLIKLKKNKT